MKKFSILYILISVCLLGLGTVYDYAISINVLNQGSIFGLIMAAYGIWPAIIGLMVFGFSINKTVKYLGYFTVLVVYALSIYFVFENGLNLNIYLVLLINLTVYVLPSFHLFNRYKDTRNFNKKILAVVIVITLQYLTVHIFKNIWLRPRMRLLVASDYNFIPWYKIGSFIPMLGDKDLILSFPSGHTASAASILTLLFFEDNKKTKLLCFLWIALVAVSRIIIGAHFLSDVVVGSLISFMIFNIVKYYLKKKA